MQATSLAIIITIVIGTIHVCQGSESQERLYSELMTNYNKLVRPVANNNDTLTVYIGLHLSQLVDVDEKNQIMISSVWLKKRWTDNKLVWNPDRFDGLKLIHLPIDSIWRPDIVLYNTAEGDYDVQVSNFATVDCNGTVSWAPPAIFRSSCSIDIEFFPFDEQICILKFGSWTYDGAVIDLEAMSSRVEHQDYRPNGEWNIVETKVVKHAIKYACCNEIYLDLTYNLKLHRNPLFYIITLVLPCILISFMSILIFYLPSDAQEKITLCISVLLALIVFLLLIPDIIPPTAQTIPLIAKYMVFTMAMVSVSIVATVVTINLHFRTSTTHDMPYWIRAVFLEFLPRVMCMDRPEERRYKRANGNIGKLLMKQQLTYMMPSPDDMSHSRGILHRYTIHHSTLTPSLEEEIEGLGHDPITPDDWKPRSRMWKELLKDIHFIQENLKSTDEIDQSEEDWRFVGLVIDRFLLWIFTIAVNIGTAIMFMQPPLFWEGVDKHNTTVYEDPIILESQMYKAGDL